MSRRGLAAKTPGELIGLLTDFALGEVVAIRLLYSNSNHLFKSPGSFQLIVIILVRLLNALDQLLHFRAASAH